LPYAERLNDCSDAGGVIVGAREIMDGVREFLENVRQHHLVKGHFQGLLHLVIGRKITRKGGAVVSAGVTWRQLADLLKLLRWEREDVRELGLNPDDLPPRDRQRFWYSAIAAAHVDSTEARTAAERLIPRLASLGYQVS
jgi:hypothetical protein